MTNERETAQADSPAPAQAPVLQVPIDIRSTSLALLALLAVIAFLYWARAVFIPITIAILASYALTPIVNWLQRRARLPKAVGAALTLGVLLTALAAGINSLQGQAIQTLEIVPLATAKFNAAMRRNPAEPPGTVEKIKDAAREIEKVANAASTTEKSPVAAEAPAQARGRPADKAPVAAPAKPAAFELREYLFAGTVNAVAGVAQLVVVIALVYFLLIAGDSFRRTLVRITGDTLSKKKTTVQILDEIHSQIQRYLLVQLVTSALLGVVMWIVFAWLGLDNALFWAALGGVLHLIPYAGPTLFVFAVALVAYVQFDTVQPIALVIGSSLVALGVIGLLLVPWLTQRIGRLNAVTVFITLLFWGWLWGVWGLLLGVPIVMAINAICERIEDLQPISKFLGSAPREPADEEPAGAPDG